MERVEFTLNDGRIRKIARPVAFVLARRGRGTYETRDMARQPMITKPMQPQPAPAATGDLEALDKEQLHALAKERGVKVHHMAGADKVRAALLEAA